MTTSVDERPEPDYTTHPSTSDARRSIDGRHRASDSVEQAPLLTSYNVNNAHRDWSQDKSSDGEGTIIGDTEGTHSQQKEHTYHGRARSGTHLTVDTAYDPGDPLKPISSRSHTREQASRLDDELAVLKIERQISKQQDGLDRIETGESSARSRVQRSYDNLDEFDLATNPIHEKTQVYKPLEHQASAFGKFVKKVHHSNVLFRYVTYVAPLAVILLIPLLLGALLFKDATVGGVYLQWFMIWLEIVWLTLWAGRILAKGLPWPIGLVSSLFTSNSKKWRDMGKQLELPATLFFWWLAIEVSFQPTMLSHQKGQGYSHHPSWIVTMNKVLVTLFVASILNFVEKILIQLIAISFHLRTYADRIELNKFQLGSLTKLYAFSKQKIAMEDSEFEMRDHTGPSSGTRTPGQLVTEAAKTTKEAFAKFGDIAGKVAGDFTGKKTEKSTHPTQVCLALLGSTPGSQVLARRLYRTFAREETETVHSDDLKAAFDNDEEAEAAFSMFDKDMNGDISMEELEAVCVEIGRERKSITASLKDLDSVIGKLDDIFMAVVFIIVVLIFVSVISTSAQTAITSAGSAVLALSWLFSATAQEFLQSVIFVFIKHPFDVGDRVTVYGNTGDLGRSDDYFVKEISLLYTEFKKMQGHVVQAPNSYLNSLFILNQRRSGALAEAVSISIKFGTTLDQIDGLRTKLLDFVKTEKREYQSNILTELRDIVDVHSMNMNVVFFYKSNWQNEGLRLARRNKFICAMMVSMQEMGIEGPYMRFPGQKQSFPMYLQNIPHTQVPGTGFGGHPDNPSGFEFEQNPQDQPNDPQDRPMDPPFVTPMNDNGFQPTPMRSGSILRPIGRPRGESLAAMNKRVDFSLGANSFASGDYAGDVYADRERMQIPTLVQEASAERSRSAIRQSQENQIRESMESGRSTSRDHVRHLSPGNLARRSTSDSTSRWPSHSGGSIHRNRFFGRQYPNGDEHALMENGMADIPENPSTSGTGAESLVTDAPPRIDPRSGMISPRAWRMSSEESNIHPPVVGSGALGRSQTEDFEMRRMR